MTENSLKQIDYGFANIKIELLKFDFFIYLYK